MKVLILVSVLIHTINAVDWINGRGARVPFIEVEAEHAQHNGQIIGNDRTYGKLSSEASQRRAVTLTQESPTFTIDLADFELVDAPYPQPPGSLSVTDAGADPTGKTDSTKAFQKAVDDGKGQMKTVYIPQGTYLLYDHVIVDQVK